MRCFVCPQSRKQFTVVLAEKKGGLDWEEFKQKLPFKVPECYYWHPLKIFDAISDYEIPLYAAFLKLGFL